MVDKELKVAFWAAVDRGDNVARPTCVRCRGLGAVYVPGTLRYENCPACVNGKPNRKSRLEKLLNRPLASEVTHGGV